MGEALVVIWKVGKVEPAYSVSTVRYENGGHGFKTGWFSTASVVGTSWQMGQTGLVSLSLNPYLNLVCWCSLMVKSLDPDCLSPDPVPTSNCMTTNKLPNTPCMVFSYVKYKLLKALIL